ncbi:hypothetical protein F5050DRAFT_113401 [Lentinula boryana]|uniref:Uncharacterized protein n=1 Tax=Lentinula boryana TaxID=40481 RepID=A0ABQ8QDB4_9AGAR|nr:hypothetical protein F5050DRAFT_113401 [Lentinula boryana]
MLPRLSSHRIVCACLFLVTSLLVTVVASPLIAMTDQLERQTLTKRNRSKKVIRIGFQKPRSDTYETTNQISPKDYRVLQLTIFFGGAGLRPRIVTHEDNDTPQLQIQTVGAPRFSGRGGRLKSGLMMDIGPNSAQLECDFYWGGDKEQAFDIMSDVERLKAETNKLLQLAREGVQAGDEFKQVHDIKDDLDYVNTCLVFLTLLHNMVGVPMVNAEQLGHWHDLYSQISRERGVDVSNFRYK